MQSRALYQTLATVLLPVVCVIVFAAFCRWFTPCDTQVTGDLYTIWLAGQAVRLGYNPYDPQTYAEIPRILNTASFVPFEFLYPPVLFLITVPLSLFTTVQLLIGWRALLLTLVLAQIVILLQRYRLRGADCPRFIYLLGISVCIGSFFPLWLLSFLSPLTLIVILALTGLLLFFPVKDSEYCPLRLSLAGIAASLLLFKSNVLIFPVAYLAIREIRAKRLSFIAGGIAGATVLSLLTALFFSGAVTEYLQRGTSKICLWLTPTIGTIFYHWFPQTLCSIRLYIAAAGMAAIIILALARSARPALSESLQLAMPIGLLCTPYAWTYEASLLLPAMLLNLTTAARNGRGPFVKVAAYHLVLNGLLMACPSNMETHLWFPLAILTGTLWIRRKYGDESTTPAPESADRNQSYSAPALPPSGD